MRPPSILSDAGVDNLASLPAVPPYDQAIADLCHSLRVARAELTMAEGRMKAMVETIVSALVDVPVEIVVAERAPEIAPGYTTQVQP